jgi:hypothetical protein
MKTYTVEVHDNGTKYWYRDGKYHREDGPAIEFADGDKFWYRDGKRHREDGPACESNGDKVWFRDGKRHREDGPAIEYVNGNKVWYLNGKKLTEAEFNNHVKKNQKTCEGHVVEVDGVKYKLVRA